MRLLVECRPLSPVVISRRKQIRDIKRRLIQIRRLLPGSSDLSKIGRYQTHYKRHNTTSPLLKGAPLIEPRNPPTVSNNYQFILSLSLYRTNLYGIHIGRRAFCSRRKKKVSYYTIKFVFPLLLGVETPRFRSACIYIQLRERGVVQ